MEDSNLIACLYLHDSKTLSHARRVIKSNPQYIPPKKECPIGCGSTGLLDKDNEKLDPEIAPGLQLTFNNGPKASQRFVFGCSKIQSDIFLPNKGRMVDRSHCYLTF